MRLQKFKSIIVPVINKFIFWLFVFLLIFIPLYPKFPLFNVGGTFVAIRAEDFLIGLLIFIWGVYIIISGNIRHFFQDRLNQALILFFLIGAVSLFSGVYLTHTVTPHLGLLHYLRRIEFAMLLPVALTAVRTKRQVKICLIILSLVTLLVGIYALGQKYLNWPVISTTNSEFSKGLILYLTSGARVNSTFAGHYDLAVFLAMALVIISALIFVTKNIFVWIWLSLLASLSFVILIMTAARLSFAAMVVGVLSVLILTGKRVFLLLFVVIVITTLVYPSQLRDRFISTVTINLQQGGERYAGSTEAQKRRSELNIPTLSTQKLSTQSGKAFESTQSGTASDITPGEPLDTTELAVYRSFGIRLNQEWPRAIRAFIKNPFLGTGYSSSGLATDNDILRSLGEVGILGTVAFAFILIEAVKRLRANFKFSDKFVKYFSVAITSVVIAFLANGLFIDVFESSKIAALFWMILGTGLAVGKDENI